MMHNGYVTPFPELEHGVGLGVVTDKLQEIFHGDLRVRVRVRVRFRVRVRIRVRVRVRVRAIVGGLGVWVRVRG